MILDQDREKLAKTFQSIERFLRAELDLEMHPHKVSISTIASGVDFLGWVHFSQHRILRTVTRRRMFKKILGKTINSPTIQSYLGLLEHGNAEKLKYHIKKNTWTDV